MIGFLMQKIMMSSYEQSDKIIIPVIVLKTNNIICLKKINNNGNYTVFIGFFEIKNNEEKRFNKSFLNGNYQLTNSKRKLIRQFNVSETIYNNLEEGKEIYLDNFIKVNDKINATGLVKGRGFTGVMKRHNFAGQPATHGVSIKHRSPGSTGSRKPRRVIKGTKMAGHYGNHQVTVTNLLVIKVLSDTLIVKGNTPGYYSSIVLVQTQ